MGRLEALRAAQLAMLKKNRVENDGNGLPATWGLAIPLDGGDGGRGRDPVAVR